MSDATPPPGHNNPPAEAEISDIATLLNADVMRDQFMMDFAHHIRRRDELLDGVSRFFETTKKIETEEQAAKATDFVGQLKLLLKDVEADRFRIARPFLAAQAAVQKFFKAETLDPVDHAARDIEARMTFFVRAKAEEARRYLDMMRKAAQKQADAAAAAALASMRPSQLEEAAKLAKTADKAAAKAVSTPQAALGQVRGDQGTVATYVSKWEFEVTDLAQVPRQYLILDQATIMQLVRGGLRDGAEPAIPGLRIVDNATVRVRA